MSYIVTEAAVIEICGPVGGTDEYGRINRICETVWYDACAIATLDDLSVTCPRTGLETLNCADATDTCPCSKCRDAVEAVEHVSMFDDLRGPCVVAPREVNDRVT